MRITDISVNGFGAWSGLELRSLSEGLNVFYGPNEAGKTTLMHFVRTIFFGFSAERTARYLPPLAGGRPGGWLQLASGEVSYTASRYADDALYAGGLTMHRGERPLTDAKEALSSLLGDVDEATFNNVFVFGLDEIQELATLGDTRAAEELYGLALGLDRVSLVDVLKELEASRERLLATDERPSLVGQLLGQRERLQAEIAELQHSASRYLSLSAERTRIDNDLAAFEAEHARWEEQSRRIALARALGERWQRRALLADRLETLGPADAFPADGLERFERLEARIAVAAKRARGLKRMRARLRQQIAELKVNDALRRHAMRVEALAEQQPWITALQKRIQELENELLELETEHEESRVQWAGGNKRTAGLSARAIDDLRRAANDMRQARRQAEALHQQSAAADKQAEEVRRRVEKSLGNAANRSLTDALAEAGELVSLLRNRVQLDERITQMTTRQSDLEEQAQENIESQMLSNWALAGVGSVFVLGCALVLLFLFGVFLPGTLGDSLGWPLMLVGFVAMGGAWGAKYAMESAGESRVDKCHQQLSLLSEQIEQAKQERDELDEHLPRGGGPLVSRLQAAERSLARLEELVPLQSECDTVNAAAEGARERSAKLRDRCRETRQRYKRLLAENGLPADLPPKQLRAFARGRQNTARLDTAVAEKRSELNRNRIEFDSLTGRITQLVSQVGVKPRSEKPLEQLQQCITELAEQQTLEKQRTELLRQIARLKPRWKKLAQGRGRLRRARSSLLRQAGAPDEVEFRRLAALQTEAQRVRGDHAQLERELAAALHGDQNQPVGDWLAEGADLDRLDLHAQEARRAAATRLSEATERRGELNHRLKLLADDRQLADKQLELEIVDQRLEEAVERWRVLATTNLLLVAVREFYEREHQPQVLRDASAYLKKLTGGRYSRVWTPLGAHELQIDDRDGRSLRVEMLSSGTREQLFLALRMALASAYARRGIELPLVLDDVLVNFDVIRARAAAFVLRDFAKRGHQVLLFTCHEHIAKLFRTVKADVRNLPDRSGATETPVLREIEEPPVEPAPVASPPVQPIVKQIVPEPPVEIVAEPVEPEPIVYEAEFVEEAEIEVIEVIAERVVEVEPVIEIVVPPPPSPPPPRPEPVVARPAPPRKKRRRVLHRLERQRWSAEEFDGELADRVRRDLWIDEDGELVEVSDEHAA